MGKIIDFSPSSRNDSPVSSNVMVSNLTLPEEYTSTTLMGSVGDERAGRKVLMRFEYGAEALFPPGIESGMYVGCRVDENIVMASDDAARNEAEAGIC